MTSRVPPARTPPVRTPPVRVPPVRTSPLQRGVQMLKAALPAPSATPEVTAQRRAICAGCDQRQVRKMPVVGEFAVCGACGCPIDRKTARADSQCPLKKW